MSTVIVLGIGVVVAAWVNRDLIRIKIASVYARVAPKPGASSRASRGAIAPLSGDAPWALSALPECLTQVSKSTGTARYVTAHLPKSASWIRPPAHLAFGDCTISIDGREAFVRRGSDRFRIPPSAQFYRDGGRIFMLREAPGSVELRVYQPVKP
ncbi:MAG TPA: hypothetical protein VKR56_04870 [Candidatus Cybelea sp.]|nr:hypothetical protein [Candidatus Cybelea sp.]